jgi:hypothetical protein
MGLRAGLTSAENFAKPGIRSPDRRARSESLYRLRYPGSILLLILILIRVMTVCKNGLYSRRFSYPTVYIIKPQ